MMEGRRRVVDGRDLDTKTNSTYRGSMIKRYYPWIAGLALFTAVMSAIPLLRPSEAKTRLSNTRSWMEWPTRLLRSTNRQAASNCGFKSPKKRADLGRTKTRRISQE